MTVNVENYTNQVMGLKTLSIPIALVTLQTAAIDMLTAWTPGYPFRFVKMEFLTTTVGTGSSASQNFQAYIGSTAITGGTLALALADTTPTGKVIQGAAPTALDKGGATDTITVSLVASGTAFTAGSGEMIVTLQDLSAVL